MWPFRPDSYDPLTGRNTLNIQLSQAMAASPTTATAQPRNFSMTQILIILAVIAIPVFVVWHGFSKSRR